MNNDKEIERYVYFDIESDINLDTLNDNVLTEYIKVSIELNKKPHSKYRKLAVEKIWDAFERLKTYHTSYDKKESANKIIETIADNNDDFYKIISDEFLLLTNIGNSFTIRHSERDKKEIRNDDHYDYLFNRCLSLINLSIKYLE